MKLDDEFNKSLNIFINEEFKEKDSSFDRNEYINIIQEYLKAKIMNIIYKLIEKEYCSNIFETILEDEYITKYTIDIASLSIEFIKENMIYNNTKKNIRNIRR